MSKASKFSTRGELLRRFACLLLAAYCLGPTAARAEGEWTRQRSGTLAWLHAVHFVDERRGWAAGSKGALLATTDGGATWQIKKRPTEDTLRDVFFVDARTGWLVCEYDFFAVQKSGEPRSYLMKTTDGGRSWSRVEISGKGSDATLLRVVFSGRERGWVFGEVGVVFATTDGGERWVRQRVPTERLLLGGVFLDEQKGWLVGAGSTFLHTADGGETWRTGSILTDAAAAPRKPERQPPNGLPRLYAASFIDERRGWAVGASGALFATTNGGRTWRALRSGAEADLFDVKFLDRLEGWAAGAGGTLIHTTDGGATWRATRTDTAHALERLFFTTRARGWAVGFGGTIMSYAPGHNSGATALRATRQQ